MMLTGRAKENPKTYLICQNAARRTWLANGDVRDSSIGRENTNSSRTLLRKRKNFACNILQVKKNLDPLSAHAMQPKSTFRTC